MRIVVFGSSLVSSYWNGAATYYRGIFRALAGLGHEIAFFEPDAFDRQAHRDIADPGWASVHVWQPGDDAHVLQLLGAALADADAAIKTSGIGVHDALLEAALPAAKPGRALAVHVDVDAPATLARMEADVDDPLRRGLPSWDLVITYGGGRPVVDRYLALGARACHPVYNAFDADTHHPVPPVERWSCDLALMANRLPDREERIESFFFDAARRLPRRRFLLGGNGWEPERLPPNVRCVGHVPTREHNVWNCSALAVLNVCRRDMAENGWSPATRVFEAAGAGACIVTDDWKGIEDFLEPESEVLVAKDGEDVARLLDGLDPARAAKIGDAARARVLAGHTYDRRGRQIDAILRAARRARRQEAHAARAASDGALR